MMFAKGQGFTITLELKAIVAGVEISKLAHAEEFVHQ